MSIEELFEALEGRLHTIRQHNLTLCLLTEVWMRKRVNNTDPVVQVRLRVMIGNFHGASHMVRLAAGSVYPGSSNHKQETMYVDTNLSYK